MDRSRQLEHTEGTDVYQQVLDAIVKDQLLQDYRESLEQCDVGGKIKFCAKIEGTVDGKALVFESDCLESEDDCREQVAMRAVSFIRSKMTARGGVCAPPPFSGNQRGTGEEELSREGGEVIVLSKSNGCMVGRRWGGVGWGGRGACDWHCGVTYDE